MQVFNLQSKLASTPKHYMLTALNAAITSGMGVKVYGSEVIKPTEQQKGTPSCQLLAFKFATLDLEFVAREQDQKLRVEYDVVDDLYFDDLDGCTERSSILMQECYLDNRITLTEILKSKTPVLKVRLYIHKSYLGAEYQHWLNYVPARKVETKYSGKDWATTKRDMAALATTAATSKATTDNNQPKLSTIKESKMSDKSFVQTAAENLTTTSKSVVTDALDVATGMAAVEVIKQIAFNIMPVKVGFFGRLMGANSWIKDNAFVTLGIVTVVHTVLKSSQGRFAVNDQVMNTADNALRYATFKAVEELPIKKLISDLSEKLSKISG